MKCSFNLTTSAEDLDRFSDREDFLEFRKRFDGVELMEYGEDRREILKTSDVVGYHMGYFPYWVDFWNGKEEALYQEFGSRELWEQNYGGKDREAILAYYRKELSRAHAYGAEYVVYHVSNCTIAESFTREYHLSDEEVITATLELLNELLAQEDGSIAFLVENLWQPGLTFTRPEMTRKLIEGISYGNKGIMLDTGHLFHMNLSIRTQEEGLAYINQMLDAHGELCTVIRGVHLNQSITGAYCEEMKKNPPDLSVSYQKRQELMFWHAFAVDKHQPFVCTGVKELIERIKPEYLTFEFITGERKQHEEYLEAQWKALKGIKE